MGAPAVLLGQQTPRLHLRPPEVANRASDAIRLYELGGQRLDPWQKLCLETGCGLRAGDLNNAAFEVGVIAQRQNGKGGIILGLLLASSLAWGNAVTVYSAHRLDTVGKTFRELQALIERTPDLARRFKPINPSDDVIETLGGNRIEFRTRTGAGGRGLTGDFVIMDEALQLTVEQLAALGPIMLARPWAQFWYVSTVPSFGDQHLVAVRQRAIDRDVLLAWAEWGCDPDDALDDPEALARANPALGRRITLERLGSLRKILGDEAFKTECMGIWPAVAQGAVIDERVWSTKLFDSTSRRSADVTLAIDVSPARDHARIGLYSPRADGFEHIQLLDVRPGVDWLAARAAELRDVLDPVAFVVNQRNGAYAMREDFAAVGIVEPDDPDKPRRGQLLALDARGTADSTAQFIDAYRRGVLRHLGQAELDAAAKHAKTRPIGDAGQIAWARRASEVDLGPVIVVTEARYGHHVRLPMLAEEYDLVGDVW